MGLTWRLSGKRKTESAGTEEVKCRLMVDYPQYGDKIDQPHYAFRIGTLGEIESVEISLDYCRWRPCRESAGYWWYDWSGYAKGQHQAVARARTKDGQVLTSEACKFLVH